MNPEVIESDQHQIQHVDSGVAASMAGAHLDTLIRVANEYPRDIVKCRDNAVAMATMDPATAEGCVYALPRGGKTIEGPSIRLAEIVARTYRNLWVQTTPIEEGAKFVTVRTVAWDVESNLCISADVRRRITNSRGHRYNDDMIGVTTAAAGSIAYRNAIFRVVPGVIWQPALSACHDVIRGDASTLVQRRDACLRYFTGLGLDVARICAAFGVDSTERIGADELVTLRGIANAIKQDGVSPDEFFPSVNATTGEVIETGGSKTELIKAALAARQAAAAKPKDSEPERQDDAPPQPAAEPEHAAEADADKPADPPPSKRRGPPRGGPAKQQTLDEAKDEADSIKPEDIPF